MNSKKCPFTSTFKDSINQAECPDSVESTKVFITKTKPVHWNVQCFKNCSKNVGVVSREEHVPFGSVCTRDIEQNSRFVIPPETGINRMDVKLNPRIFKQIANVYRMPVLDMFASALNHQVPKYFSWTLDPQAVGMDAFSVNWNKGLLYMFPPFSLIRKCLQKIIEDKATVLLTTPVWQSRPWYPMLLNLLYDRPLLLPHNPQILKLPWSQTIHPLFQNRKFRLAIWPLSGDLLKTKNFQKGCAKYCRPHGNLVQKNIIRVLGNNSLAGVHKGCVIRFLAL